jgi:hypothetical protein
MQARLLSLPSVLKAPLVLRVYDEMSVREIAITLGLSISAVKSRMVRARKRFCMGKPQVVSSVLKHTAIDIQVTLSG